jgi:hypothetical protein
MKYKELLEVKKQLDFITTELKEVVLIEEPNADVILSMGRANYLLLEIERFITVFEEIKYNLENYYFQDNFEDFDFKKDILFLLGVEGQFSSTLPTKLSKNLKEHLLSFTTLQVEIESNLKETKRYVLSSDNEELTQEEMFEIRKTDLTKVGNKLKIYVENYEKFKDNIINLTKKEKYGKMLDLILN